MSGSSTARRIGPVAYLTGDLVRVAEHDADLGPVVSALGDRGFDVAVEDWNDATVDWSRFGAVVVRSPWDYHLDFARWERFLLETSVVVPFINPAPVISWNQNKRYLAELAFAGVHVVHTDYCDDVSQVRSVLEAHGDGDVVVKPCVSAGSRDTMFSAASDPAVTDLATAILSRQVSVMVQPAIASVALEGEVAAIAFGGEVSHWAHKAPLLARGGGLLNGTYSEQISAVEPSPARVATVGRTLDAISHILESRWGLDQPLPFARIDTVIGDDGSCLLLEAELFEPSFFCEVEPRAATRFAEALMVHLAGTLS